MRYDTDITLACSSEDFFGWLSGTTNFGMIWRWGFWDVGNKRSTMLNRTRFYGCFGAWNWINRIVIIHIHIAPLFIAWTVSTPLQLSTCFTHTRTINMLQIHTRNGGAAEGKDEQSCPDHKEENPNPRNLHNASVIGRWIDESPSEQRVDFSQLQLHPGKNAFYAATESAHETIFQPPKYI